MRTNFGRRLLASTTALGALLAAAPLYAQTAPAGDGQTEAAAADDVVVTGSRINRPDLAQSSPVNVIGAAELNLRQPQSIEQVLRQLPGTAVGIGTQVNNGQGGVSTFNLRGLGANRNLVLLNNRRIVPSTLGNVVDLNIIPVALIERSEIQTGGAVTSYGADAVAGVVNFVTRQNFQGIDVRANYGVTERGDGQNYRLDFLTGANFDDGKGNVIFAATYTNVKPVLQGDRDLGLVSRQSTCTAAQNAAPGGCAAARFGANQGSPTAVPATLFAPVPATGAFVDGARFDPATGSIVPGQSDFNFNPLNLYQTPVDRWTIYGASHYEFVPNVEFYTEGFYTRSRVVQNLAPTGSFSNTFQLPLNNQFLTDTQRNQLCTFAGIANCAAAIASGQEISAQIGRRFVESGPRVATFESNLFQFNIGLRGKLVSNLKWDAFVQYGEANRRNTSTGTALADRLQAGLRNCPAGSPAGCVPTNIFGAAGSLSQAAITYLGVPTSTFINTRFTDVQGLISGDFGFHTPWTDKPLAIAFGAEYRRYSGGQFGDLPSTTPGQILGSGGAFTTINGSYYSEEAFGEVNFPLATDKPFVDYLAVEAGFRYADYSNSGGNWTYKFGGNYAPIKEIKFRGTYTQAVRAPNIGELFAPVSTGLNNLATDPCQLALPVGNATVTAICTAQLAAAGLPASRIGAIPRPNAGQINITSGGNPNLQPETATTYTVGLVLQPGEAFGGILRGFTASVDWYEVNVTGAITSPTVGDIVNGCFSQASPTDLRCTLIRRDPLTGGLSGAPDTTQGVILASSNLGFLQVRGVDFNFSYTRRFGAVNMNWNFNGNYTDRSRFQSTPSSFIRECVGSYSVSCDPVLPQWSWNLRTTASVDAFDFSILWRHIDPTRYEPRTAATQPAAGTVGSFGSTNPATIVGAYRQIPAYNYLDFSLGAQVNKTLRINLLVENLLDDNAPDVGNTIGTTAFNSGNTFPSTYDPLGRRFLISAQVRF